MHTKSDKKLKSSVGLLLTIDSNQKEPMIQIDHFKAKLQSHLLRNFLLQYLLTDRLPDKKGSTPGQGFHKLMHSSLRIVTLGHGPFFSESADASVRLGLLHASFLLHHPSDSRVIPNHRLSLERSVTPTSQNTGLLIEPLTGGDAQGARKLVTRSLDSANAVDNY